VVALDSVGADDVAGPPLRALANGVPKMVGAKLALKLPNTVPPPPALVALIGPDVGCRPGPVAAGPLGLIKPSTVNAVRSLSVRSVIGVPNVVSIGDGKTATGCMFALGFPPLRRGRGCSASEANAAVPLRVSTLAATAAVALSAFDWWRLRWPGVFLWT
ncbi:hypothetical protein, partial [Mycobacterium sp.]|uniref:hypothetical protein n=1 Tax=Mycobacterium sp. TaxID=1785 RepID=UPI002DB05727|nr:hypothetical protein [Mycobacterium sp.]